MGPTHRHHHRLRLTGLRKASFLIALAASLLTAAITAAATAAPTSTIGSELMKALESPGISPARTAALAVELVASALGARIL